MQPFLNESYRVVVFRWAYVFLKPKMGDVVVFSSSDGKEYVKRVTDTAAGKNEFIVKGDNKEDSKKMPPIRIRQVIGRVIAGY